MLSSFDCFVGLRNQVFKVYIAAVSFATLRAQFSFLFTFAATRAISTVRPSRIVFVGPTCNLSETYLKARVSIRSRHYNVGGHWLVKPEG